MLEYRPINILGYTSLDEVAAISEAVGVFDVLKHAQGIDLTRRYDLPKKDTEETTLTTVTLGEIFLPPRDGLYLPNHINPLFNVRSRYYYRENLNDPESYIANLEDILKYPKDIYDSNGNKLVRAKDIPMLKKVLTPNPTIPSELCRAGIGLVLDSLNRLSPYTHCDNWEYSLESVIRPELYRVFYEQELEIAYDDLLREVQDFVGKDVHNHYFYRVTNSSLVITKSVDFRIYEWFKMKFEEAMQEQERA